MTQNHQGIGIVISDPHPVVRAGLRMFLDACSEFTVLGECAALTEIGPLCATLQPDLLLFGHRIDHTDSVDQIRSYLGSAATVRALLLCSRGDKHDFARALNAGFRGVFLKESPLDKLRVAIKEVNEGAIACDRDMVSELLQSVLRDAPQNEQTAEHRMQYLNQRQRQIVDLVMQGLSNQEIALRLLVSRATVAYNLTHIYRELKVSDRMQLILSVRKS